jgi:integrase
MKLDYPKVKTTTNQKVFVSFYINNRRFRLYNGFRIGSKINPNSFPEDQRICMANLLAAEVFKHLQNGGILKSYRDNEILIGDITDKDYLKKALEVKSKGEYSDKYKRTLTAVYKAITSTMKGDNLTPNYVNEYLDQYTSGTSYNTVRRHLNVLINEAVSQGMDRNPLLITKSKKSTATLNKPFKDVSLILNSLRYYNTNLHLCCLMTYGCLLRPHREIRELTWGDFSEDLSHIHLSGERNKSGRNRIVPVPSYIRELLVKGEPSHNIFSGKPQPYNEDYFKSLWSRFKKQSKSLETGQTLYSFRHTGAIDIFKRTGSLTKLQKAMGHSSINVSLTYLRGLEVAELTEDDMPLL